MTRDLDRRLPARPDAAGRDGFLFFFLA
jgi:hypothetical protein